MELNMSLPSLSVPEFQTEIPSTGEKIKYRPFLVKEEKLLLMAMEGQDQQEIVGAVLNLLKSCILTDVDVYKLATFDIEYLFARIRGKSVGEVIELKVKHQDNTECHHLTKVEVNIDDIKVVGERSDGNIMLTDDIGVKLTYPTYGTISEASGSKEDTESIFNIIVSCIEFVFDNDNVYSDFSKQELKDWLDQLNQGQFQKIAQFFESIPKMQHTIEWTCKECGETESMTFEGLQSFFT
jgi:hypothetical protein